MKQHFDWGGGGGPLLRFIKRCKSQAGLSDDLAFVSTKDQWSVPL